MRPTWSTAVRRVAELLGRRRSASEVGEGEEESESGFTLIELMVVLLIMGILMAIAIPTFLGVTSGANDRSVQSNLTNAMTSAKAIYVQGGTYPATATMAKQMKKAEPELTFVAAASGSASTNQNKISVYVTGTTKTTIYMAAWMTKTKICWVARDIETGGTPAGVEYAYATHTATTSTAPSWTKTTCYATNAKVTGATFSRKWPLSPAGH